MIVTEEKTPLPTIRVLQPEDAPAVAELSGQLGYESSAPEIAERIRALLANPEQVAFAACLKYELVGWIEAAVVRHLQSPAHTLIGGLVVRENLRGLGVGRRLCEEVERWTRQRDIAVVRVTSRSTREAAHRFYLRDGYRQTKTSAVFEKVVG